MCVGPCADIVYPKCKTCKDATSISCSVSDSDALDLTQLGNSRLNKRPSAGVAFALQVLLYTWVSFDNGSRFQAKSTSRFFCSYSVGRVYGCWGSISGWVPNGLMSDEGV